MKTIPLTQGKVALVDDCDYEFLIKFKWHAAKRDKIFYVERKENRKNIFMHRVVMERHNPGFKGNIDHIDGNGSNNQYSNLRIATCSQNGANSKPYQNCSSKYKGVHWHNKRQKWVTKIMYQGVRSHLGYFDSEIEAAIAYDIAAIRLYGPFARTNFPRENYAHIKPISVYVSSFCDSSSPCRSNHPQGTEAL